MNISASRLRRTCDIVMKGGITSGVVYPSAITTLAARFDFKNIGGTSAGAIAAAGAAAAQYRRVTSQSEAGFERLGQLPTFLGTKTGATQGTRLFSLFLPNAGTRRLFAVLTGFLKEGNPPVRCLRVVVRTLRGYFVWALMGAIPGMLLFLCAVFGTHGAASCLWWIVSLGALLVGALLGSLVVFACEFVHEVPRNFYGLCSGVSDATCAAGVEPLTQWLNRFLNEVAGLDPLGPPLTFGQLWGTQDSDPEKANRIVNLEMMTTCLTHGRPYRLPFRDDEDLHENNKFYYREEDFRRLFPENVVRWMADHTRASVSRERSRQKGSDGLREQLFSAGFLPLPKPADLPVVVATRMSLSFPILLSAVPLYCIDHSLYADNHLPERCWFSDGGICSNFPLHFFDAALPRRPTFSIDLTEKRAGTPKDQLVPEMPSRNVGEIGDLWGRFDTEAPTQTNQVPVEKPDIQRLKGFLGAIIRTMQNWTDATQSRLPGYRDRIVRVPLTPDEGGLNLDMPPELIGNLTERGIAAAHKLLEHFDVPPKTAMSWDNHRWVRLRSFLACFEKLRGQVVTSCDHPENGDRGFEQWLKDLLLANNETGEFPPSYPMTQQQLQAAVETLAAIRHIDSFWKEAQASTKAPRPRPVLRPRAQT